MFPLDNSHSIKLKLDRENRTDFGALAITYQKDFAKLGLTIEALLSKQEQTLFAQITSPIRQNSFLLGRYTAKMAIQTLGTKIALNQIDIQAGIFNQPLIGSPLVNTDISLSHNPDFAAAIAYPSSYIMGIDIENRDRKAEAIERYCTPAEIDVLQNCAGPQLEAPLQRLILWTIKESLSKTLKCGMMVPFSLLEIDHATWENGHLICTFKNFGQYKSMTILGEKNILSIVLPKRTTIH